MVKAVPGRTGSTYVQMRTNSEFMHIYRYRTFHILWESFSGFVHCPGVAGLEATAIGLMPSRWETCEDVLLSCFMAGLKKLCFSAVSGRCEAAGLLSCVWQVWGSWASQLCLAGLRQLGFPAVSGSSEAAGLLSCVWQVSGSWASQLCLAGLRQLGSPAV